MFILLDLLAPVVFEFWGDVAVDTSLVFMF